jgi:cytochrome c2
MSISSSLMRLLLGGVLLAIGGCGGQPAAMQVVGGDAGRGKALVQRYGCIACHSVPGLDAHGANVGPPLVHMAERGYLAGLLPNTVDSMVLWLTNPPAVDPDTAMPNLGVSRAEALDIAAFLYGAD